MPLLLTGLLSVAGEVLKSYLLTEATSRIVKWVVILIIAFILFRLSHKYLASKQ